MQQWKWGEQDSLSGSFYIKFLLFCNLIYETQTAQGHLQVGLYHSTWSIWYCFTTQRWSLMASLCRSSWEHFLCFVFMRGLKKRSRGILFALGRDKKERLAKYITYSLQCILHTEVCLPWIFGAVLYGNRNVFCTEKYFCESYFWIKVHANFICIYCNITNISVLFDFPVSTVPAFW